MVRKIAPNNAPRVAAASETPAKTPEGVVEVADFDTALHIAGYGRFSYSVLCACAIAFFTTGVQNALSSYVLPAASCELRLSTYRVGLINVAFMCGGVASAFLWGIVADVFGHKRTLALTLLADAALTLGQSSVRHFSHLVAARAVNGFLIGGPGTLVMTYLSDTVGPGRRQLFLNVTGLSFTLAWLVLPAMAWLVMPYKLAPGRLGLDSWRLYLAACSVPGLLSGLWLLFLPESPRLLLDTDRGERALLTLANIYSVNTGRPSKEFPVKNLIPDARIVASDGKSPDRSTYLFLDALKQLRCLLSKTYAVKSSVIAFIFFANMAAGFGLSMWIPELLVRMKANSETNHHGTKCGITHKLLNSNTLIEVPRETLANGSFSSLNDLSSPRDLGMDVGRNSSENLNNSSWERFTRVQHCKDNLDAEVYISGLIVGACCVLGNAACACACSLGARGVRRAAAACAAGGAAACAGACACACACAGPAPAAVAAVALLNAAALNGNVLLMRLMLHALPPRLSALGVCWGAWWGRAGGVATNLAVGALLDVSCAAPFIGVAAVLAVSVAGILLVKDAGSELETAETDVTEPTTEEAIKVEMALEKFITTHM